MWLSLFVSIRVVGVYAKRALLVDIAIPHGDDDRIYGNVHHEDVEKLKTNAKRRNGDNVETSGTDGKGLEKPVQYSWLRRDARDSWVAKVE